MSQKTSESLADLSLDSKFCQMNRNDIKRASTEINETMKECVVKAQKASNITREITEEYQHISEGLKAYENHRKIMIIIFCVIATIMLLFAVSIIIIFS